MDCAPLNSHKAGTYRPRKPRASPLYQCAEHHVGELRDEGRLRRLTEAKVIARFLQCGDPHHGFARVYCPQCRHDYLLAFSCNARRHDEVKKWSDWNTPREYKKLDGTGRRLLLYDKTRSAITVEAEIGKVEKFKNCGEFPVKNTFVPGSLKIDKQLVPLARIQKIFGFENFKSGRAAAWNVTQQQYRQLGISRTQGDRGQRFAL